MMTFLNFFCINWIIFWTLLIVNPSTLALADTSKPDNYAKEELSFFELEQELLVSVATKSKMTEQEAPSIVTVITGEEIQNMGARNIVDVLRKVPGFDILRVSYYHEIYVRGMSSVGNEKVKVMINGHTLQPFLGTTRQNIGSLPVDAVKQIEIIRGPGSAIYGTDAFLGVINIITKEGGDDASRVSFEAGSFDTVKPYAQFSYQQDDFKAFLCADYFHTDGYDGTVESDFTTTTPGFAPSASRKMNDENQYYNFHSNISYNNLYFSGFFQKAEPKIPINGWALTDEDDIEYVYAYGEFGYKQSLSDKGKILIKTYYDFYDCKSIAGMFPPETAQVQNALPPIEGFQKFPPGEGLRGGPGGKWSSFGLEISGDYELYSGIRLMVGTAYEYTEQFDLTYYTNYNSTGKSIEIDGITYPSFPYKYFGGVRDISNIANWSRNEDRNVTALYAQGIFDLKQLFSLKSGVKNLSLTIGGRYDNYNDVGSTANPRIGIVYAPTEKLWFKALYGTAFRAPAFTELYLENAPIKGNPDLKPEKITTTEALIGCQFTKNIKGSITGFKVNAKDIIQLAVDTVAYENIGKTESYGIETEFIASFGKNKYAYLNFTWQDVKDTSNAKIQGTNWYQDDFNPGRVPEFYGNAGINYGITENIIGNLSLNYVGERKRSEEKIWNGKELVKKDSKEPVEERWLLNASLAFRDIIAKGISFQITCFNLLNDEHRDPDPGQYILNDYPQPGRTFTGKVSYSF